MTEQALVGLCRCGCGAVRAAQMLGTPERDERAERYRVEWTLQGLLVETVDVEEARKKMGRCQRVKV